MGKMKRFFSLMLVLTIVLGSFSSVFAAEDAKAPAAEEELKRVPKDVIGTEYEKAVARLVAFGVLDGYKDGTYRPEQDVTRAEFAKILVEALGIGNAAKADKGKVVFKDVPASHWASGYVSVASGMGLLKGFPDKTFRPEQQVSYADALTMLVRSLGYQDEFLKGVWPGSHIAKAAEAGITAGVNFADARGFANRGNVAQVVNNTLDCDVVKVKAYKDGTVEYEESEKTLLKDKLDISKYEDTRVIADKIVDDGLQEDEITVRFLKEIKKDDESVKRSYDEGEEKDFTIRKGVNPRLLIGEEVSVYMDDKDNIVYIESEKDDRAYFDTVEKIEKGKDGEIEEIGLVRFDKEYKFDKEARVYLYNAKDEQYNEIDARDGYIKADIKEIAGKVGKFVVKNNRIIYAEIMDPAEANPWMLVRKNDKGLLEGINDTIEDFDIDLRKDGDYDGVIVFDTLGNRLDVDEIEEGNIIYVQQLDYDGDDYAHVVVVQDNVKEGKLSKVKEDRLYLGDTQLKAIRYKDEVGGNWKYENTYYSVEGFEDIKKWDPKDGDWEDDMEDADGEDMVAYLDATGKVAFLSSEGITGGSGYKYGVVTRAYADNDRIKVYTFVGEKDGEEITYKADKDKNLESPRKLDKYGNADGGKDNVHTNMGKNRGLEGHVVKFKLNKDGEIAENEFFVMDPENFWVMQKGKDFGKDSIRSAFKAENGEEKTFYVENRSVIIDAESLELNADKDGYKSSFDSDDFGIVKWEDIAEDNYDEKLQFYVFTKRTNDVDVDAVVFIGKDGLSTASDEEAIYVIDKWTKGGDVFVKYVSYEDGKVAEREVDKLDKSGSVKLGDFKKERPFVAKMKSGNKIELFSDDHKDLTFVSGVVSKRDGNILELDNRSKEYRLSSGVVVYDEDVKKTTSNIRVKDEVTMIVEDGVNVRVVSIGDQIKPGTGGGDDDDKETTKNKVTYINSDGTRMEVNGTIYKLDKDSVLYDKNDIVEAIGNKDILVALGGKLDDEGGHKGAIGAEVKDIKVKDGVVTSLVLVQTGKDKKENDENAAKAVTDKIDALPKVDELKLKDKAAVKEARKAYDDLTKAQKNLVKAETLKTLEAAEAKIKELEEEQEGKQEQAQKDLDAAKAKVEELEVEINKTDEKLARINKVEDAVKALTEVKDKDIKVAVKETDVDSAKAYFEITLSKEGLTVKANVEFELKAE